MEEKKTEKKILGSVAVDSQTGMEHYDQPKQTLRAAGQTVQTDPTQELRDDFQTPNYGESNGRKDSQNLAGVPEEFMRLFEHDPSEVIYTQALRHPIGVIAIYVMGGAAAFLVLVFYWLIVQESSALPGLAVDSPSIKAIGSLVALIFIVLAVGITILSAYLYRKSRLILTNQKVVLIQYHSLIAREVSQINIGEVEDVNVSQPTIFDRTFKTGRITIETAGEQNNYVLTGIQNPYDFAHKTVQMHEGSIVEYGN